MFLVKLLGRVVYRFDGYTARGKPGHKVLVRVCHHSINSAHPGCGQEFLADGGDLVEVQYGPGHN